MSTPLAASLLVALAAANPTLSKAEATLSFARFGEPVASHSLEELQIAVGAELARVHEPYEDRPVEFAALPLPELFDAIYSPSWRRERDLHVLFTCADGYQPTVPLSRFLDHASWLAFERLGAAEFAIDKLESGRRQTVSLGPFYVVWDNAENEELRSEGDYGWPYQVVAVDLVRTAERFPHMVPPPASSDRVRDGFAAFQVHCSRCHAVNGDGGRIGPELMTSPSSILLRGRPWLRRWIEDPSSELPAARMPRFNPEAPNREATIEAIIDYLYAMAEAAPGTSGAR
ncbi:MAG: cytochrome c [Myxococcales bacterium]|nr:cytochrome c [Myxococcales bacterium]